MNCIGCDIPMEKVVTETDTFHQCKKCKRRFVKKSGHLYEVNDREKLREVRKDEYTQDMSQM